MVSEADRMPGLALPSKYPAFWASVTVPLMLEPAGATVLPSATMGSLSVAPNGLPWLFVFKLSSCCVRTVHTVPASVPTGLGRGGGGGETGVGASAGAAAGGAAAGGGTCAVVPGELS